MLRPTTCYFLKATPIDRPLVPTLSPVPSYYGLPARPAGPDTRTLVFIESFQQASYSFPKPSCHFLPPDPTIRTSQEAHAQHLIPSGGRPMIHARVICLSKYQGSASPRLPLLAHACSPLPMPRAHPRLQRCFHFLRFRERAFVFHRPFHFALSTPPSVFSLGLSVSTFSQVKSRRLYRGERATPDLPSPAHPFRQLLPPCPSQLGHSWIVRPHPSSRFPNAFVSGVVLVSASASDVNYSGSHGMSGCSVLACAPRMGGRVE